MPPPPLSSADAPSIRMSNAPSSPWATGDAVKARYTYVYVFEDNQWKIGHHHSSVMPEGIDIATPIAKNEDRGRHPFVYVR